ncbi:MAG: ABC transporter substrate-binding protein, partial [Actinomycetota bacterium]
MRIVLVAVCFLALGACSRPTVKPAATGPPPQPPPLFDDENVPLPSPVTPGGIVSLAPQFTEVLFALGAGERIVAVGPGETFPPQATALPSIPAAPSGEPDPAAIIQLRPSLVLAAGFPGAPWKAQLREAGLTVATFNAASISDALSDIASVARVAGLDATGMSATLNAAVKRAREDATDGKEKVFVEAIYPPLTGAGMGGFVEDMVKAAGGELAAPAGPAETFQWSPPDIVSAGAGVYLAPLSSGGSESSVRSRPGFSRLADVRIEMIEDDLV